MVARRELSPNLMVSGQLVTEDLRELARAGVRTIINNRPDGEEPGQPSAEDAARIVGELGLTYRHFPVTSAGMSLGDADAFAAAVTGSSGPVHAHCRSGARSTNLWMLGRLAHGEATADEARRWASTRQVDLAPALAAFERSRS